MKNLLLKNTLRAIPVLLFYLALFLYAAVFNNASGWVLFFFLTFLFFANLISLIPSHKNIRLEMLESSSYQVGSHSQLVFELFNYRPLLMPLFAMTVKLQSSPNSEAPFFPAYWGKKYILSFDWTPKTRGVFTELPVILSSTDFLKLFAKQSLQPLKGTFPVLPQLQKLTAERLIQAILALQPDFYASFGNHTFNVRNFREHHMGDPLRMIDWKQSSKRNELIVKEYEQEQEQAPLLILYGQQHENFEELLSIYYTTCQLLKNRLPFESVLLADYPTDLPDQQLFAVLQPEAEAPILPSYANKTLILFAPERTDTLLAQVDALERTNELFLVTIEADRPCLYREGQVIPIDTEEVTE